MNRVNKVCRVDTDKNDYIGDSFYREFIDRFNDLSISDKINVKIKKVAEIKEEAGPWIDKFDSQFDDDLADAIVKFVKNTPNLVKSFYSEETDYDDKDVEFTLKNHLDRVIADLIERANKINMADWQTNPAAANVWLDSSGDYKVFVGVEKFMSHGEKDDL